MIDLDSIFYEDFYDAKWSTNAGEVRSITWSAEDNRLKLPGGDYVLATESLDNYLVNIRKAFKVWDNAIESIAFEEKNIGNSADITIAATDIDGSGGINGYWNYALDSNRNIIEATIRFDSSDLNNGWLLTTAMHEIGNVLGLGDLSDSNQYKSVQEDPFPKKFKGRKLWEYDKTLIDQIYTNTGNSSPATGSGQDKIVGTEGKEKLIGTNGNDEIIGKGGADKIVAKNGDDLIDPGLWTTGKYDTIKGGNGIDTFVIKDGYWAFIKDFNLFEDKLDVSGLSQGLDWKIDGGKTYIYGDDGYEVARLNGRFDLADANFA